MPSVASKPPGRRSRRLALVGRHSANAEGVPSEIPARDLDVPRHQKAIATRLNDGDVETLSLTLVHTEGLLAVCTHGALEPSVDVDVDARATTMDLNTPAAGARRKFDYKIVKSI